MAQWRKVIVSGSDAELNTLQVGGGSGGSGVTVSTAGAVTADAAITAGSSFIIGSADINETDLEKLDGITNGAGLANKALVLDGSADIVSGINNLLVSRLEIDADTNYIDVATDLKVIAAADIVLDPGGNQVLPGSDAADDLGASGTQWKDLYVHGIGYIDQLGTDADPVAVYVNSGELDGVVIGGESAAAATITTLNITSMGSGWTNAGNTIANLGTVTTATSITSTDLIGTNVDGILGADTARAITGTTIDATGDFTIDGLVLTADTITNDAVLTVVSTGLTLNASLDIALSADGGNVTMDDGTITVFDFNTDTPEFKIMDDAQVANYASIAVGDNGATTFTTVDTDAAAANLLFTVDGTVDIDSAGAITLDSGGAINLEPLAGSAVLIDGNVSIDGSVITGVSSITSTTFSGTLDGVVGSGTPAAGTFTSLAATGNATITGDLTVNGTTTTLATTNLVVQDPFIFAATGSADTNVDAGLIVQSGSAVDVGSALYQDKNSQRWAVAKGIAAAATAVTPLQMVVTTAVSASSPHSSYGEYGVGEMWIETDTQDIWIRTA